MKLLKYILARIPNDKSGYGEDQWQAFEDVNSAHDELGSRIEYRKFKLDSDYITSERRFAYNEYPSEMKFG
jgi:hypothetical protein